VQGSRREIAHACTPARRHCCQLAARCLSDGQSLESGSARDCALSVPGRGSIYATIECTAHPCLSPNRPARLALAKGTAAAGSTGWRLSGLDSCALPLPPAPCLPSFCARVPGCGACVLADALHLSTTLPSPNHPSRRLHSHTRRQPNGVRIHNTLVRNTRPWQPRGPSQPFAFRSQRFWPTLPSTIPRITTTPLHAFRSCSTP
jgi:hypothetical protein